MVPRFNLCDETKVNLDRVSLQDSPILVILVEIFDGSVRNEEGEKERDRERQRNEKRKMRSLKISMQIRVEFPRPCTGIHLQPM